MQLNNHKNYTHRDDASVEFHVRLACTYIASTCSVSIWKRSSFTPMLGWRQEIQKMYLIYIFINFYDHNHNYCNFRIYPMDITYLFKKHDSLCNFRYDILTLSNNEMNIFQFNLWKIFCLSKTCFVIKQNALLNLRLTCK